MDAHTGPAVFPGSLLKSVADRGFLAVSFFFVLSGFILAYNYPVILSIRDYLLARTARIVPVYYLSLLFSLPLGLPAFEDHGAALIPITICNLLLIQAWVPPMSSFWDGPAWTLSCEAFFYALLPVFVLIFARRRIAQNGRWLIVLAGCFAAGLILPAFAVLKYGAHPTLDDLLGPRGESIQLLKLYIERYRPCA